MTKGLTKKAVYYSRSGFILLVVLTVLGLLSFLAISFYKSASIQKQIQQQFLAKTQCRLTARSGIEMAVKRVHQSIITNPEFPSNESLNTFEKMLNTHNYFNARASDSNGKININDGINAGRLEHAHTPIIHPLTLVEGYQANAIDPWPEDTVNPGTYVEDISAVINLRIRRLLNAYGDAHKFVADLNWPVWERTIFDSGIEGSYGQKFTFTSSCSGPRDISMPGAEGLGDYILTVRPSGGFKSIDDIKGTVNSWADNHLPSTYFLNSFFEIISNDLTINSYEDQQYYRLKKEPANHDDNYLSLNPTIHSIFNMKSFEVDPPDFSNVFVPHSIPLININSCSDFVRAAVFFAPSNVSFSCFGYGIDDHDYDLDQNIPATNHEHHLTNFHQTYGVSHIHSSRGHVSENGFLFGGTNTPPVVNVQFRRLMSMRDSLALSLAYRDQASSYGWPDNFFSFKEYLRYLHAFCPRKDNTFVFDMPLKEPLGFWNVFPNPARLQTWKIFPHILSTTRRMPVYLGSPAALITPYRHTGEFAATSTAHQKEWNVNYIDDFVYRARIPKISFIQSGKYSLTSIGKISQNHKVISNYISCNYHPFQIKSFKSQKDFLKILDASSSPDTFIGPEPSGVDPSEHIGAIGLIDAQEKCNSFSPSASSHYYFENSLSASSGDIFVAKDPDEDDLASPDLITIIENPPVAYPPPLGSPYDPSWMDAIRNTSPAPTDTWRVPEEPRQWLVNGYYALINPGSPPPTDTELIDSLNGPLTPYGGATADWDRCAYLLCMYYSTAFSWEDWFSQWINLPPGTYHGGSYYDDSTLRNSHLEGNDVSLFNPNDPSDLSPFGGLNLLTYKHGARAPNSFNDSLYFRPEDIIASGSSAGKKFNNGLISLWFRIPHDYTNRYLSKKNLIHLVLWEQMKVDIGATGLTQTIRRPVYLSVDFTWFHNALTVNANYGSGLPLINNSIQHPMWTAPAGTPTIPYPSDYSDLTSNPLFDDYLGGYLFWQQFYPSAPPPFDPNTHYETFFQQQDPNLKPGSRAASLIFKDSVIQPGAWNRVVVQWDFRQFTPSTSGKLNVLVNGSKNEYSQGSTALLEGYGNEITFNPKMILSIGEKPTMLVPGSDEVTHFTSLERDTLYPCHRLNSSIDNLVMYFGNLPTFNDADELSTFIENEPNFKTKRYNISSGQEPEIVLNPNLPASSKILAVTSKIYDFPNLFEHLSGQYQLSLKYNAPRVDTICENSSGILPSTKSSAAIAQTDVGPQTVSSPQVTYFGFDPIGTNFKIKLVYRNEDPHGRPLFQILNIPWIKEVTIRYQAQGGLFTNWKED